MRLIISSPVEDVRSLQQVEDDLEKAGIDNLARELLCALDADCYRPSYLEIARMWLKLRRAVPDMARMAASDHRSAIFWCSELGTVYENFDPTIEVPWDCLAIPDEGRTMEFTWRAEERFAHLKQLLELATAVGLTS
ncbi:hypothetical protein ACFFSW_21025 [Saccharothrix longispora]|uniref:Uncharacterized protein n=1 Tax=Saccharothrix longispora TaxID=33920 RepID=A0ABU1Q2V5_9PSEU|nr:hypothetical protein [Saccharothrix longispora]MDR6597235.1 hypothetical protein [Saccharothrix longispora]